jgi:hypothetical protein
MPLQILFDQLPIGHAAAAAKNAPTVSVRYAEFTSSEDGQEFIQRLEGFPSEILGRLPENVRCNPSQVDHLLAVIRRDCTATVYLNELPLTLEARPSRAIQAGERMFKNDIVDITRLDIGDILVPDEAGLVWVFSVGWRKGLYYDFSPLGPDATRRTYDLPAAFGQMYSHVLFQERLRILESEWDALFKAKWFPFAGLQHDTVHRQLQHLRAGWDVDELTGEIVGEVKRRLPSFLELWRGTPALATHLPILERAAERFTAGDSVSCTGLVFPRIEGIMRSYHAETNHPTAPKQANLCAAAVSANAHRPECLFLPFRFEQYLSDVYFASFDPTATGIGVSRNSVAHGVASAAEFSDKAAVIGLLVVQHLCYCFRSPSRTPKGLTAGTVSVACKTPA